MVEPRLIYALKEVYMGRPKTAYRSEMAYMQSEGRFYIVGKGFIAVVLFTFMIVIGSQPMV
jgi:hypothetical protein